MATPKVKVLKSDSHTEASYLCFVAKNITRGLFSKSDFHVLPYIVTGNPQAVYFPNLDYSPSFWQVIADTPKIDYGDNYPKSAVSEIVSKFTPTISIPLKVDIGWQELEQSFDTKITSQIKEIEILPTCYGTAGSFYPRKLQQGYTITMTHRADMPPLNIRHILYLALSKIAYQLDAEIGEIAWHKRQAIADFATHRHTTGLNPAQITDSHIYLAKLGFPSKVEVSQKFITSLSPSEKTLWQLLLSKSNVIVSFDEAASTIWQDQSDDKFSLYSLAKLVENVRRKLREFGIHKQVLFTLRKQGYLLSL